MRILKSQINLKIVNNTALSQDVQILGIIASTASANGSNALYEFDLTGQNFTGVNSVTIEISNTSNPTVVSYTVAVATPNIQGVVDALNTLGQGNFSYQGNIVYAPSSYYIYGDLTVSSPSLSFISNWDSSNTSPFSSALDQIQLPLNPVGTYNFVVDWGDGNTDTITSWNQTETLHTYATAGFYTIKIDGTCIGWQFDGIGDRDKILSIDSWGSLNLGNSGGYFFGCSNLDLSTVSDVLNLTGTTNLSTMFSDCTSLTTINNINSWDMSNVIDTSIMFNNCTNFNQNLNSWDMSSVVTAVSMFKLAVAFNGDITNWDVSSLTNTANMFSGTIAFNQPIGSWNVSNVGNMDSMFIGAVGFNQDIGSWDVSNVGNFAGFMTGKSDANYSSSNLDSIYNQWSLLTLLPNVTANFGTIKYTVAGSAGRAILTTSPNNWVIIDGGI